MSFIINLNYKKNLGDNLVYKLDDSFRNSTLNEIVDYLISIQSQLGLKDKKIIDVINTYRRSHFDYLEQERIKGTQIERHMELMADVIKDGLEYPFFYEYDPILKRDVINLDKSIMDFIHPVKFINEEGKELYFDVLKLHFYYPPCC